MELDNAQSPAGQSLVEEEVLVLAFGPVQAFVAAARKTQDLTLGSRLLSELSTAGALAVHAHPGVIRLVIPYPATLTAVPISLSGTSNKLVAIIRAGSAKAVADAGRASAMTALTSIVRAVKLRLGGDGVRGQLFDDQIERFLESTWAAVPLHSRESFGAAREQAELLLDGRKALRDFMGYRGVGGLEKASVDGCLEGVLEDRRDIRRRLGPGALGENEQLDAMGLVRRIWKPAGLSTVPSTPALAVTPWRLGVASTKEGAERAAAVDRCRETLAAVLRLELNGAADLEVFEHDLSWVLQEKADRRADIAHLFESAPDGVRTALGEFENAAERLLDRRVWRGRPTPYYAVVTADGDRVGAAFSTLELPEAHESASEGLARFATAVRDYAHRRPDVHVVYAGGDDLLALTSIDASLPFARAVHDAFTTLAASGFGTQRPTLSVGLAVAHARDALRGAIELARTAERAAKNDGGDRLAVVLSKRSGGDLLAVSPFDRDPAGLLDRLVGQLRRGEVPRGFAYELSRLAPNLLAVPAKMACKEVDRLLRRKRGSGGALLDDDLRKELIALCDIGAARRGEDGVERPRPPDYLVEQCERLSALLRIATHFAEQMQAVSDAAPKEVAP